VSQKVAKKEKKAGQIYFIVAAAQLFDE